MKKTQTLIPMNKVLDILNAETRYWEHRFETNERYPLAVEIHGRLKEIGKIKRKLLKKDVQNG